jgi:hypothetical protein
MMVFDAIFEFFWWFFSSERARAILKANLAVSLLNYLQTVTTIVEECSGAKQWKYLLFFSVITAGMITLGAISGGGFLLATSMILSPLITLASDMATQDCKTTK